MLSRFTKTPAGAPATRSRFTKTPAGASATLVTSAAGAVATPATVATGPSGAAVGSTTATAVPAGAVAHRSRVAGSAAAVLGRLSASQGLAAAALRETTALAQQAGGNVAQPWRDPNHGGHRGADQARQRPGCGHKARRKPGPDRFRKATRLCSGLRLSGPDHKIRLKSDLSRSLLSESSPLTNRVGRFASRQPSIGTDSSRSGHVYAFQLR